MGNCHPEKTKRMSTEAFVLFSPVNETLSGISGSDQVTVIMINLLYTLPASWKMFNVTLFTNKEKHIIKQLSSLFFNEYYNP